MNKWKIVKRLALVTVFLLLVALPIVPLSHMLRPADDVRNRIVGFYAEPEQSLDVVVVGNSAVYRYINNPQLFKETGITSYNFASPGLSSLLLEGMIDEAKKTQSPEVYIIDIRKLILTEKTDFKENRFQQIVCNLKYSENRKKMIDRMITDPLDRLQYYFDIIIYHGNWEQLSLESLEYADSEREDVWKSWLNVDKVKALTPIDVTDIAEERPLSAIAEDTLISLLEKCKNENINALFLSTPWQIDDETQMKTLYTEKLVTEYGFKFLDMNVLIDEMDLSFESDFFNRKHVNAYGAEKVTKYLGEYLLKNYDFDLNHDEDVVASWEKAAQLNEDEMKKLKENREEK